LSGTFVDLDGKRSLYMRGRTFPGLRGPLSLLFVCPWEFRQQNPDAGEGRTRTNESELECDAVRSEVSSTAQGGAGVGRILKHVECGKAVSLDFRRYTSRS